METLFNATTRPLESTNSNSASNLGHSNEGAAYSDEGAAFYLIMVILTYSLFIICLIASISFRKKRSLLEDQEAANYLEYRNDVPKYITKVRIRCEYCVRFFI